MAATFQFDRVLGFTPETAEETLKQVPAQPGVFALFGARAEDAPYLTQTTDMRRRMRRLLNPPASQSKRLNLRDKVVRIEYCLTGSAFESALALYQASATCFGYQEARRRLRLHTPYFLRLTLDNAFPRLYVTNKLTKRGLGEMYGPFPSRTAAERYCDAVLDLFKLRRCHEELAPYPEHPGCVYGEMNRCIAPCKQACTPEQYAQETAAVKKFLDTRGESLVIDIGLEREEAANALKYERAAALHAQWQKVRNVQSMVDWITRPIPQLRAIVAQSAAVDRQAEAPDSAAHSDQAALFLLEAGCIVGPERLSTLGVRAVREQTSVGSSLFAQPLMLQAIPLDGLAPNDPADSPEVRATQAIATLEARINRSSDLALLSDHLSLFRRWYYRPEKQRQGEIFLPVFEKGVPAWSIRRILRGAARLAIGDPKPMAETDREAAPEAAVQIKTRILHEGRPDVERTVPVLPSSEDPDPAAPTKPKP